MASHRRRPQFWYHRHQCVTLPTKSTEGWINIWKRRTRAIHQHCCCCWLSRKLSNIYSRHEETMSSGFKGRQIGFWWEIFFFALYIFFSNENKTRKFVQQQWKWHFDAAIHVTHHVQSIFNHNFSRFSLNFHDFTFQIVCLSCLCAPKREENTNKHQQRDFN